MKIYFTQVERILNTLPIGTYLGRRIPVTLHPDAQTSYIDLVGQQIVVAFKNIEDSCEKVEDASYVETAIRTCLYHEVSHAILTNTDLFDYIGTDKEKKAVMNIMEDERIETVLRHYYKNVDFEKNIKLLNGWTEEKAKTKPKNEIDAFYRVVRFHSGKPQFVEMAEDIVERYGYLTVGDYYTYYYLNDTMNLFYMIQEDFLANDEDSLDTSSSGMKGEDKSEDDHDESLEMDGEGDDTVNEDMLNHIKKILEKEFSPIEKDNSMYGSIFPIITQFNRKTAGGSAVVAHSGILNPRLAGRNDYKFFERKSCEKGSNKFTSVHLNLFLDESGSYCHNVPKTNQLINALCQVEKMDKNFTLDIVYCGISERIVEDKTRRTMEATGGNDLDEKIFDIYRRLQKPNTYNYNIVLFDGDAFTDSKDRFDSYKNFGAFNHANCTVISDPSNEEFIRTYAPSAKKVFTCNYVKELQDNVISALRLAFR